MRILLVEDEAAVSSFLIRGLTEQDHEVVLAKDGLEGKIEALKGRFDLMILDVMLPRLNGLDLCRIIRSYDSSVPILMLSAMGTLEDKVAGLTEGADDYLIKPFHFKELLARISALTRVGRLNPDTKNEIFTLGDLILDKSSQRVTISGNEINLTAKEYSLLQYFLANQGRVLSRIDLAKHVWGNHFDTGTNSVDVYVNYLRSKIEKGYRQKYIYTLVGRGYMCKYEVEDEHSS